MARGAVGPVELTKLEDLVQPLEFRRVTDSPEIIREAAIGHADAVPFPLTSVRVPGRIRKPGQRLTRATTGEPEILVQVFASSKLILPAPSVAVVGVLKAASSVRAGKGPSGDHCVDLVDLRGTEWDAAVRTGEPSAREEHTCSTETGWNDQGTCPVSILTTASQLKSWKLDDPVPSQVSCAMPRTTAGTASKTASIIAAAGGPVECRHPPPRRSAPKKCGIVIVMGEGTVVATS